MGNSNVTMSISHLLFAYVIIFCDSNCVLTWLEVVTDLTINLAKSLMIVMVEVENIQLPPRVLRCKIDSFPTTYLYFPLRARFKNSYLGSTIDRFEKKLSR